MLRVYGYIADLHDTRLVAVAILICIVTCYTAFSLLARVRQSSRFPASRWIAAAALVSGCGIWATHFVSMLGFQPGLPVSFELDLTILSAVIAIAACWWGYSIAILRGRAYLGGAIAGAAVGVKHYTGMHGTYLPAQEHWDLAYVGASLAIGIGFGALALAVLRGIPGRPGQLAGAILFAFAVCGMHFTGMAAVSYTADPAMHIPEQSIAPLWLAIAITAVTLFIVGLGLLGALVDKHLAEVEEAKLKLERTAIELQQALVDADTAVKTKTQFLATVSHELRTPLNAVIGFSEILKNQVFGPVGSEAYRGYATDIYNNGTFLLGLINDILDLSKLDAGRFELREEAVNLNTIVLESRRFVESQIMPENVEIAVSCESWLPDMTGDVRRLRQIVINLLSNAVKFTLPGGKVRISTATCDGTLVLKIADTGIGIAPEDMSKVMERFGQIDSAQSRKYEGAGLGLPLAKQLIELHGGTFSIESTVGAGTTVCVCFPQDRVVAGTTVHRYRGAQSTPLEFIPSGSPLSS